MTTTHHFKGTAQLNKESFKALKDTLHLTNAMQAPK